MTTVDEILNAKRPLRKTVWLAMDNDAADLFNAAVMELAAAKSFVNVRADDPLAQARLAETQDAYDDAKRTMEEKAIRFDFQAIGRKRYEELLGEHPATKEQQREARATRTDVPPWNPDTFPQVLIAESLVEPQLSVEDVQKIWDSAYFNSAEIIAIFEGARDVNQTRTVVDLGKD